jgi:hypothetical protein
VNGTETEALAGTITADGTAASAGLELRRLILTPPEGASPNRFTTFALVDSPLVTLAGVRTSELT